MIHPPIHLRLVAIGATLVAATNWPDAAVAQKQSVPKQAVAATTEKSAVAENNVVKLLLIMKPDKNGNISREEFNKLVDAEFDLLAKNQTGMVNVKDLVQPDLHAKSISFLGK